MQTTHHVPGLGSASLWAPRLAPSGKKPAMKLPPALILPPQVRPPTSFHSTLSQDLGHILIWAPSPQLGTEEAPALDVRRSRLRQQRPAPRWSPGPTPSQLRPRNVWLQSPFACSSGCLQCSVYLKYRRIYHGREFLCAVTRLCKNLHLPAKTRKHLQLPKFFFSVSELKLLINRRRYHSHNSP